MDNITFGSRGSRGDRGGPLKSGCVTNASSSTVPGGKIVILRSAAIMTVSIKYLRSSIDYRLRLPVYPESIPQLRQGWLLRRLIGVGGQQPLVGSHMVCRLTRRQSN